MAYERYDDVLRYIWQRVCLGLVDMSTKHYELENRSM